MLTDQRFNCENCNASFTRYFAMKRHQRRVHTLTRRRESHAHYVCEVCGRRVLGRANFNRHMNTHSRGSSAVPPSIPPSTHRSAGIPEPIELISCGVCRQRVAPDTYAAHLSTHDMEAGSSSSGPSIPQHDRETTMGSAQAEPYDEGEDVIEGMSTQEWVRLTQSTRAFISPPPITHRLDTTYNLLSQLSSNDWLSQSLQAATTENHPTSEPDGQFSPHPMDDFNESAWEGLDPVEPPDPDSQFSPHPMDDFNESVWEGLAPVEPMTDPDSQFPPHPMDEFTDAEWERISPLTPAQRGNGLDSLPSRIADSRRPDLHIPVPDHAPIHNQDAIDMLHMNRLAIKSKTKRCEHTDLINVGLLDGSEESLTHSLYAHYRSSVHCIALINCGFGFLLRHKVDGHFKYFHTSPNNEKVFGRNQPLRHEADLTRFLELLSEQDLYDIAHNKRPSTEWQVYRVTNLTFFIYKTNVMGRIGNGQVPKFIRENRNILSLDKNSNGKVYDDNLCFFRCLAISLDCQCGKTKSCSCAHAKKRTLELVFYKYLIMRFTQFPTKSDGIEYTATEVETIRNMATFPGVGVEELYAIENLFQLKVVCLEMDDKETSRVLWCSDSKFETKVYLNIYQNHASLIRNISAYSKTYECPKCKCSYTKLCHVTRHKCITEITELKLPSQQCYAPKRNVFDDIEREMGIDQSKFRFYPYYITWDCETYMSAADLPSSTEKAEYTAIHKLLSIAVCSNVPGFDTAQIFFTDGDTDKLIARFLNCIEEIQMAAALFISADHEENEETIEKCVKQRAILEAQWAPGNDQNNDNTNFSTSSMYSSRDLTKLLDRYREWQLLIPVVGFNSAKYDVNVMKGPLLKAIHAQDKTFTIDDSLSTEAMIPEHIYRMKLQKKAGINFAIKKGNKMQVIQTQRFRFLDITAYLAGGTYDQFLKAYGCEQVKSFFPYEYIDSPERLDETSLPPHEAFFSSLKQKNISSEEYADCQRIWRERNMTSLKCWTEYYSRLDVEPFCEAIAKMQSVYALKGIDMLRDAISLPGLAVQWLFAESDVTKFHIPLISPHQEELYTIIKENIVGGPSIVFHRYHEKGVTRIREWELGESAKLCDRVVGFDANALYLYAMSQPLPTGELVWRRADDGSNFKPVQFGVFGRSACAWLDYIAEQDGIYIQHKHNGKEVRVGQHGLPVDGFDQESNTVYQYHGCLWHGHLCRKTAMKNGWNANKGKSFAELALDTERKEKYLRALGYKVVVMRECEWEDIQKCRPSIAAYVKGKLGDRKVRMAHLTTDQVVAGVCNGSLYGLIECDLIVPPHLYEYFSEMPPIFKNVKLTRDDLSEHMKTFAEENDVMRTPTKALIGSMYAKKILLLSTLAKWYIEHGLTIIKVYQFAAYEPKACFADFTKSVSNARRAGDVDPSMSLIADTNKLIGNSCYGKTITDVTKFTNIRYHTDARRVSLLIKNPRFRHVEELTDEFYEVESDKKSVVMDTPVILGFAILQIAKLRMLELYYDCLSRFVDRNDFQMCQMDTDSAYMALSGSLESVVKPQERRSFYEEYGKWFPQPYCNNHRQSFIDTKLAGSEWTMGDCCQTRMKFDRRTPGLFKEEFSGDGIVALNSKTYYCWKDDEAKMSTKGLQKSLNHFTKQQFLDVLRTQQSTSGTNRGFIFRGQRMITYKKMINGLTYLYAKRAVCDDGVSTEYIIA